MDGQLRRLRPPGPGLGAPLRPGRGVHPPAVRVPVAPVTVVAGHLPRDRRVVPPQRGGDLPMRLPLGQPPGDLFTLEQRQRTPTARRGQPKRRPNPPTPGPPPPPGGARPAAAP